MRVYSIQPSEMEFISSEDVEMLFQCVPMIEAKEALVGIKIAEYPNLKPEARRKMFKDLKKLAYPSIIKKEARAITMADLASMLKG
jgi:hypothetical protein